MQALALSIKSPQAVNNTFIVCPDDVMTYEEWVTMLAQKLDRTLPLFHLPLPIVKLTMHVCMHPVGNSFYVLLY